jgi:hypothetical protein
VVQNHPWNSEIPHLWTTLTLNLFSARWIRSSISLNSEFWTGNSGDEHKNLWPCQEFGPSHCVGVSENKKIRTQWNSKVNMLQAESINNLWHKGTLLFWRWKQQVALKCWKLSTRLHDITAQNSNHDTKRGYNVKMTLITGWSTRCETKLCGFSCIDGP